MFHFFSCRIWLLLVMSAVCVRFSSTWSPAFRYLWCLVRVLFFRNRWRGQPSVYHGLLEVLFFCCCYLYSVFVVDMDEPMSFNRNKIRATFKGDFEHWKVQQSGNAIVQIHSLPSTFFFFLNRELINLIFLNLFWSLWMAGVMLFVYFSDFVCVF